MDHYVVILILLASMLCLSAVADKIRLPYPVLLIVAGIAIGFIPSMPAIELDPDIIFLIFLPPLLYDAAFNIPMQEFRTHWQTISGLATSLVFLSASGIAVVAHYMIPGMSWPVSFVLGAILSATDAVSALGITKNLKLPHKTSVILEGESLINDASALVAYRFALAAVAGVGFIWWKAWFQFLFVIGGGLLVGFIMGRILSVVLRFVRENNMVTISFMLLQPFITYEVAEYFHVSGVIAVVVLGLSVSRLSTMVFPKPLKQESKTLWDIIIFFLNGLIFLLIGLQFPYVLKTIDYGNILPYIGYALIITVVALMLRMARVFLQQVNLQRAFAQNKGRVTENALLDFKTSLIISWSGMRGIVSLATAIALPLTLSDGTPFPQRSALIFISVAVVLFTIVGQGMTLPWLIRKLKS